MSETETNYASNCIPYRSIMRGTSSERGRGFSQRPAKEPERTLSSSLYSHGCRFCRHRACMCVYKSFCKRYKQGPRYGWHLQAPLPSFLPSSAYHTAKSQYGKEHPLLVVVVVKGMSNTCKCLLLLCTVVKQGRRNPLYTLI